jgi:LacI family transcriptional regulator
MEQIKSFQQTLAEQDFHMAFFFFNNANRVETLEGIIKSRKSCDGMLLLSGVMDESLAVVFKKYNFPHVCLDFRAEQYQVNTVENHESDGIRQAVDYLLNLGHRQIGYIGRQYNPRFALVVFSLATHDILFQESQRCLIPTVNPGEAEDVYLERTHQIFGEFLDRGTNITAFVCQDDTFVKGAMMALQDRGMTPGKEISLVGYDNIEERGTLKSDHPIITTVDNPSDMVGRRAGELLLNQILRNQREIVHERIPVKLIVRSTTGSR